MDNYIFFECNFQQLSFFFLFIALDFENKQKKILDV